MQVEPFLAQVRQQVDSRLNELLPTANEPPALLHEAMRYACLAPGKRLRPALCMAAERAFGAMTEASVTAGCAIEMVHVFSLIHDDLPAIDNDDLRRGKPTCHKTYGEAIAILAGDALFSLAFEVTSSLPNGLKAVQTLAKASGTRGLVGGEVIDVLAEGRPFDLQDVELIHYRKTATLIAASVAIGAIVAGADEAKVQSAYEFGIHVGIAFQITDDILNETATAELLGKAVGSDRERKKATYPALMGLEASRAEAESRTEQAVSVLQQWQGDTGLLDQLARYAVNRMF